MTPGFWRVIDAILPPSFVAADPERRERGRLLAAFCALSIGVGLGMAPLDAAFGASDPSLSLAASGTGLVLLLLLRWTGWVDGVATLLILALAFLATAMNLIVPLPGAPYKAWVLVMGLTPLIAPNVRSTAVIIAVVIVASLAFAVPPAAVPTVTSPGDVVFMLVVAWAGMSFILDTHRMALAEHATAHAAQRALERDVDAANRDLAGQAREAMAFLMTISHELRTPLNGVLGLTSLLADEAVPDAARRDLAAIQESARAVLRVFETLLCLTRQTAQGPAAAAPTDLPGVVDAVVARAAGDFGDRGRITRTLAPDLPRVVLLDADALRVLLAQVIGSALDAGVPDLRLDARCLGAELVIALRGGPAEAAAAHPLDLGLSLAEELANEHAGQLICDDHDGGFGVTLTFPCRVAALAA